MSAYSEILAWSRSRPVWQQDALRKVALGVWRDEDVVHAAQIIKAARNVAAAPAQPPVPLSAEHLPKQGTAADPVRLVAVREVANVALLAPGQKLPFARSGLTAVYGDNGSGKTSYSRILKSACRARGARPDVLPSVYSASPRGTPTALLDYEVGDRQSTFKWCAGADAPDSVSQVSIFDAAAAAAYVQTKQDVVLAPAGLDLLRQLADVCGRVRDRLQLELDAEERVVQAPLAFPIGSQVATFVQQMTCKTSPADVEKLATITAAEETEVARLRDQLAMIVGQDPAVLAKRTKAQAGRLDALRRKLFSICAAISDDAREKLRAIGVRVERATAAARLASDLANDRDPLPGVGTTEWRAMWDAARAYSTEIAYAGKTFPAIDDNDRCVLCHQELEGEARERLARFDEHVRHATSAAADEAKLELEKAIRALKETEIAAEDGLALLTELGRDDLRADVEGVLASARTRRDVWVSSANGTQAGIPALNQCDDKLAALATELEQRVRSALAKDAAGEKKAIQTRLTDVDARSELARRKDEVFARIRALGRIDALRKCLSDADSTPVTRKSGDLTKQAVTDALCQAFNDEVQALGLGEKYVELKAAGASKGALFHQLGLRGAQKGVGPSAILSEGEKTASALALFLAEVGLDETGSAIVFDDPISSMDHLRRDAVARRLVEESERRQVVVFTHDVVFLLGLLDAAKEMGVPASTVYVQRTPEEAGKCSEGLPWIGQKTSARVGVLKARCQELEALHRRDPELYAAGARGCYGLLRETWERAIEEVLLGGVIERFRLSIQTQPLSDVDITPEDRQAIKKGMTKTSRWLPGHDQAAAVNSAIPEPQELRRDITDLENWVKAVRTRREQAKKTGTVLRLVETAGQKPESTTDA